MGVVEQREIVVEAVVELSNFPAAAAVPLKERTIFGDVVLVAIRVQKPFFTFPQAVVVLRAQRLSILCRCL